MVQDSGAKIDITLAVTTYNRSKDLGEMLSTAVAQETEGRFAYEILIVDNNSTDGTKGVVDEFINAGHNNIRYLFEPKQGRSNALKAALNHVRGDIYTIVDDDFILPNNWILKIFQAFERFPDVTFVSGKVLPLWTADPPKWLTKEHWSAIAMADYGDELLVADANNQICFLACSFKTRAVLEVGGYRLGLGVTPYQGGGVEDLDLLQRLWDAGHKGIFLPDIWFHHKVSPNRCTKEYHRYWHTGHGAFYAAMRDRNFERSGFRLFDVPSHLYRQALLDSAKVVKNLIIGDPDRAFTSEVQLRFFIGFWKKRFRDARKAGSLHPLREVASILRGLGSRSK